MGEAKRRQRRMSAVTQPTTIKDKIATVVRAVNYITLNQGGDCVFRAVTGHAVLRSLGLAPKYQVGGVLFRAGPDARRDCIGYAGDCAMGCFYPDGRFWGHVWLTCAGEIIDFSVGDWRTDQEAAQRNGLEVFGGHLGETVWQVDPPRYIWASASDLCPSHRTVRESARGQLYMAPPLGKTWYLQSDHTTGDPDAWLRRAIQTTQEDAAILIDNAVAMMQRLYRTSLVVSDNVIRLPSFHTMMSLPPAEWGWRHELGSADPNLNLLTDQGSCGSVLRGGA